MSPSKASKKVRSWFLQCGRGVPVAQIPQLVREQDDGLEATGQKSQKERFDDGGGFPHARVPVLR
jgi:hypothetical protein